MVGVVGIIIRGNNLQISWTQTDQKQRASTELGYPHQVHGRLPMSTKYPPINAASCACIE